MGFSDIRLHIFRPNMFFRARIWQLYSHKRLFCPEEMFECGKAGTRRQLYCPPPTLLMSLLNATLRPLSLCSHTPNRFPHAYPYHSLTHPLHHPRTAPSMRWQCCRGSRGNLTHRAGAKWATLRSELACHGAVGAQKLFGGPHSTNRRAHSEASFR